METFEFIVVGGGPVGLLLACELRLRGASVVVLEQRDTPDPTIKAATIGPLAGEMLERRGFAPQLREAERALFERMASMKRSTGGSPPAMPAAGAPVRGILGHFAGLFLLDAAMQDEPARRPVGADQQAVEAMLAARAAELGVALRRGHELVEFEPTDLGVTAETRTPAGTVILQARYLVGCDGGRSFVRKHAGFEFPGTPPTLTGYQALVDLVDPEQLLPLGWRRTPRGMLAYGPVPGRILAVEFEGSPAQRDAPITLDELQGALRRVSGTDVTIRAIRTATRWTDNARVATDYRRGRVLLAGDAAHVHSPFGGQGMNLGMGDAMNLGWKLAAALAGWAPPGLLDSYSAERQPAALRVVDNTRAQVALMRPDPQTSALRELFTTLLGMAPVNAYLGAMMRGLDVRYPIAGDHPLIGHPLGDLALVLADGTAARSFDLCHDGRGLLIDLGAGLGARTPDIAALRDRLRVVEARCDQRPELGGVLIRPDGYVAWAVDRSAGAAGVTGAAGPAAALATWFGAAAPAAP